MLSLQNFTMSQSGKAMREETGSKMFSRITNIIIYKMQLYQSVKEKQIIT